MNDLDALNKLNSIAFSFYTAGAFSASCNIGVYDHLKSPKPAGALADDIGINADGTQRLLSALESLGLVEHQEAGYVNTQLGAYLTKDSDKPMAFHQPNCYFYHMWEFLPDALKEYGPRHQQAWGQSAQELYKAIYGDPAQIRHFFRLLDSYNWPIGAETAERVDFSRFNRVLDVAGGTGTYAATVIKRHPHLTGVCLDLAPLRPLAEEMIEKQSLQGRFEFITGDMFENTYPDGCDVVFLSYILHNWNDDKCAQILKNCYAALPEGGMLLISEKILHDDYSGDWWATMMNLQMLIAFEPGAKERTESEYTKMIETAGFRKPALIRLNAPRDLLIAYK